MRYLISMAREDDDERTDATNPSGLTIDGHEQLIGALLALGFEDIDVSADEQIDSGV